MNDPTSTKTIKPSAMTGSRANPIKAQPGDANPPLSAQDARQGRGGKRVLTILIVGIVLALTAFVAIGTFSEEILTMDVNSSDGGAVIPGPTETQERLIEQ